MTTNQAGVTALPTLYTYCVQIFQSMTESAQHEKLGIQFGDQEGMVFEGFLTKIFKEEYLAVPYYTKVMRELKRMGCVQQLQRGGSTTPSRWLLIHPPTPELWVSSVDPTKLDGQSPESQQIQDLNRRIAELEEFKREILDS